MLRSIKFLIVHYVFRKVFILTLLLNITYDTIIKLIPKTIRIYHNVALRAPLKRVQRDHGSRQVKMATNHPKNCRDRA